MLFACIVFIQLYISNYECYQYFKHNLITKLKVSKDMNRLITRTTTRLTTSCSTTTIDINKIDNKLELIELLKQQLLDNNNTNNLIIESILYNIALLLFQQYEINSLNNLNNMDLNKILSESLYYFKESNVLNPLRDSTWYHIPIIYELLQQSRQAILSYKLAIDNIKNPELIIIIYSNLISVNYIIH